MQTQSETIRFEVMKNGESKCVAGIDGFGVLSVDVHWVLRDPAYKPNGGTLREWCKQELKYHVGGVRSVEDQHVNWAFGDLAPGDEVTIRILGPGDFDEPANQGEKQPKKVSSTSKKKSKGK
jgi:hypothetical protein